jgi:hypothetical protein
MQFGVPNLQPDSRNGDGVFTHGRFTQAVKQPFRPSPISFDHPLKCISGLRLAM